MCNFIIAQLFSFVKGFCEISLFFCNSSYTDGLQLYKIFLNEKIPKIFRISEKTWELISILQLTDRYFVFSINCKISNRAEFSDISFFSGTVQTCKAFSKAKLRNYTNRIIQQNKLVGNKLIFPRIIPKTHSGNQLVSTVFL